MKVKEKICNARSACKSPSFNFITTNKWFSWVKVLHLYSFLCFIISNTYWTSRCLVDQCKNSINFYCFWDPCRAKKTWYTLVSCTICAPKYCAPRLNILELELFEFKSITGWNIIWRISLTYHMFSKVNEWTSFVW